MRIEGRVRSDGVDVDLVMLHVWCRLCFRAGGCRNRPRGRGDVGCCCCVDDVTGREACRSMEHFRRWGEREEEGDDDDGSSTSCGGGSKLILSLIFDPPSFLLMAGSQLLLPPDPFCCCWLCCSSLYNVLSSSWDDDDGAAVAAVTFSCEWESFRFILLSFDASTDILLDLPLMNALESVIVLLLAVVACWFVCPPAAVTGIDEDDDSLSPFTSSAILISTVTVKILLGICFSPSLATSQSMLFNGLRWGGRFNSLEPNNPLKAHCRRHRRGRSVICNFGRDRRSRGRT